MRAGTLRHWLTFEQLIVDLDTDGAQVESWVDAFDIGTRMPAEVTALSGRELIAAQAIHSKITTRVSVRYRHGFEATMRARLGATLYDIHAVIPDPDSRIRSVSLLCSSGTTDG